MPVPLRGQIWYLDLDASRGREQAGKRPALVLSSDTFNRGPASLAIIVPITSKSKGIPLHVAIDPPEGGVTKRSFIMCEAIRSISQDRLSKRWGEVSSATLAEVEDRLRVLLNL